MPQTMFISVELQWSGFRNSSTQDRLCGKEILISTKIDGGIGQQLHHLNGAESRMTIVRSRATLLEC